MEMQTQTQIESETEEEASVSANTTEPTARQYAALQALFDHFNAALWGGNLPSPMLTLSTRPKTNGYYIPGRWLGDGTSYGEIALNSDQLHRDPKEVCGTLVHEMAHHWHEHLAPKKPSRSTYHDGVWGAEMERVGLMPSATGEPGGKKTGQKMTHYVIKGGEFEKAFEELGTDAFLPFVTDGPTIGRKRTNKKKPKKPKSTAELILKAVREFEEEEETEEGNHVRRMQALLTGNAPSAESKPEPSLEEKPEPSLEEKMANLHSLEAKREALAAEKREIANRLAIEKQKAEAKEWAKKKAKADKANARANVRYKAIVAKMKAEAKGVPNGQA